MFKNIINKTLNWGCLFKKKKCDKCKRRKFKNIHAKKISKSFCTQFKYQ